MSRPPKIGELKPFRAPRRVRFGLANGIRVTFIEDHRQPLVSARFAVAGGTALVALETPGLALALAELLTEGTESRTGLEIAETADAIGGRVEAGARRDNIILYASGLSENAAAMFGLLAEVAFRPCFPEEEVALRRRNMLEELRLERGQANFLAAVAFNRRLFEGHPYAIVSPTEESIARVDRDSIQALHRRIFGGAPADLVVVGDLSAPRLREMLDEAFQGQGPREGETSDEIPLRKSGDGPPREVVVFDRQGSEQVVLKIGQIVIREGHPDFYPLLLANQVLGGSFAARLSADLREIRGYTYGIYSSLLMNHAAGVFSVGSSVATEVIEPAIAAVLEHIERMRTELVEAGELRQAKNMLVGEFARELETQAGIASAVLHGVLRGLPEDYLEGFVSRVQAVSAAQVREAAARHLHLERLMIVVVGDGQALAGRLEKFGPVVFVDAEGKVIGS